LIKIYLFKFQREGKPYCTQCYGAMFGPKGKKHLLFAIINFISGYGHGGSESHTFHGGKTGQ
jgi:hypothetical protein